MIEVEVKIRVNDINSLISLFLDKGFERESYVEEIDTYYTSKFHDFKANDEALRIRTSCNLVSGKIESFVTYKGKKLDDISMSRLELETGVMDAEVMDRIFTSIGLIPVTPVKKKRLSLTKGNITACIDDVEGLGGFLELEIIVEDESMRKSALADIEIILNTLGLCMADTIRTSYLSMLEEGGK